MRTVEQEQIVESAKTGTSMVVRAFAGTGKTYTLVEVAKELGKQALYVAFNKSIAEEASNKFPSYVTCKTMHSLAWGAIIKNTKSAFGKKLQGFFSMQDIPDINKGVEANIEYKLLVTALVKNFCQSSVQTIEEFVGIFEEDDMFIEVVRLGAVNYWNFIVNPATNGKITHDVYLKLFQLSKPVLNYSLILLDEAQDSNPVTLDIVYQQKHAQIILVGDSFQAIYEWRGATNALDYVPVGYKEFYLSESFRFTSEIAKLATGITAKAGNTRAIIGKATKGAINSQAVLVRTNSKLLDILLDAYDKDKKVYILADLKDLWAKLYHINSLCFGQTIKYPDKELSQYATYKHLVEASEKMPELARLIKASYKLSNGGLYNNINKIKSCIVDREELADFTLSTIHKSKGLEWDEVTLADDVIPSNEGENGVRYIINREILNQLYVAVTRGKYKVSIPFELDEIIEDYIGA